jgi:hypothetical protein
VSSYDPRCSYCNHLLSTHCKGGVPHTNYKEDSHMLAVADRRATAICAGKHCLNPLCDCPAFVHQQIDMFEGEK